MQATHAVGIDLGTTYSCISYLNEHGEPVTLPNQEGELATPSAVLFDEDQIIVGTEALRNAIVRPDRVIQDAKRSMGKSDKVYTVDGKPYSPVEIAGYVLRKLLTAAEERIGPIEQAVITVPAQFSDSQRHATIQAGHRAGLQRVDIINEPVAAALCYVLGGEGLAFTELAADQRIMVYDLGGGTFDLSLVRYTRDEVSVIASAGDLELGGIDWTRKLQDAIADQFAREFGCDPREDPESLQFLRLEAEQTKRSLTVRPRAAMTCQHGGHRKSYQVEQKTFEKLTRSLVERTGKITRDLLRKNKMGWAHVDVLLTTGGASRMPMVRASLQGLSGRTLNTTLSPDHSISHGAAYYAGMLLAQDRHSRSILTRKAATRLASVKQQSVNARGLGILVRDKNGKRVPYYLIPPNTTLPVSRMQRFGTASPNQERVHLQVVESGTSDDKPHVKLGDCVIRDLPPNLPEGSEIEVTISYDDQARVHVSAKDVSSGRQAQTEILRQENLVPQLKQHETTEQAKGKKRSKTGKGRNTFVPAQSKGKSDVPAVEPAAAPALDAADEPIPLCNSCGEPLDHRGRCAACDAAGTEPARPRRRKPDRSTATPARASQKKRSASRPAPAKPTEPAADDLSDDDFLRFFQ